jgi:Domain of unknown function (DUF4252)
MQRAIKHIFIIIFSGFLLVSCNQGSTLQSYFVEHQESKNFIAQDLPISILKIDDSKLTQEQKEAYKSVKRLNFLAFKIDSTNTNAFDAELTKVKTILKDEKYNELIDFNYNGAKVSVKYIGDDDLADEFIVFGSSKEMGFGIVRVLGDDMSPEKMMAMASVLQSSNIDKSQFNGLMNFFK